MIKINKTVPHSLSKDEALKRIKNLLSLTKQKFGDKISDVYEDWNGYCGKFSFMIMGHEASGVLEVHEKEVQLSGEVGLPWLLSWFKGKIESTIEEEARKLLV
ncbi:hypothetical protein A3I25_01020 [Candidatus Nomurabacteria bacterium RIFCSPLOWO2_02_FULL_42_17]|uniref:Polyhydroxyalkanoic acid system protein n=2 Tax=Candidatus Nomuraibacteriota TaxID=1752729 RepID=A0A1F6WJ77_9BACT|nr:MAG: hypothetical protein A3B93_01330 [Candidatus Nomurabacteria bacterium RIFCSPHIGHO2_02_FULL_42_24]OGI96822.1 MAG: hypothetical protein A3I25_01020 [Candidatus Nomurabacteria bacterium RIFCSPLOWO2_02_FULL_42_17]